jgi:hypothetical protein
LLKITLIGLGRDFLLPFLSRKKEESNKKLTNEISLAKNY